MLNRIIAFSLQNRLVVLAAAAGLMAFGAFRLANQRVDVLPDLNRPTVTIMTEAPGLAPEEIELLVTFPIESMLNGATGVERVRSASGIGLSVVWVEFAWGTDINVDRQTVAERLQLARERLPRDAVPVMAPVSSIMGEIMLIGYNSLSGETPPQDVRTYADWIVRPEILALKGVAQVTVMGGGVRQYQVTTSPQRLQQYDVTMEDLVKAVEGANINTGGGFIVTPVKEYLIRILGSVQSLDELGSAVVKAASPTPVLVKHVADVSFGHPVLRGDGSINGRPAVILAVQKQPGADTLALSASIDATLARLSRPADIQLHKEIFRQEEFIRGAIRNVSEALRDGAILVVIVLFVFLWNLRTSVINLVAIPLSLLVTAIVFDLMGLSINTMTLGGIAVAIGELVDDSIVDVENIFRRLRENRNRTAPEPFLAVVFKASSEVRNSIVYATLIILVVLVPLLSLSGIEGRLFAPIGIAYGISLLASLAVSLTVTPVLASHLLPRAKVTESKQDAFLLRALKAADRRILNFSLKHPAAVMAGALVLLGGAVFAYVNMGREFLPPFNEGTFTVNVIAAPGTSLEESNRLGTRAEMLIREIPEVESTARRTGRAELDEHAENVNYSEIDVRLRPGRPRRQIQDEIRDKLAYMVGAATSVGQPISHRIDHLLSGVRAQIAVKLTGPDLAVLRTKSAELADLMSHVPGVIDLNVDPPQIDIPQVKIRLKSALIQRYGLSKKEVAEALETALKGRVLSQVVEEQRILDLVVWFDEAARQDPKAIEQTLVATPSGGRVPLSTFAEVVRTYGPNTIRRENVARQVVVSCNVHDRDLSGVVADLRALEPKLNLPAGARVEYGGQFEAQEAAMLRIYVLSIFALVAIALLLYKALDSWRAALQCMANLPLAFVGGVIAIYLFGGRTLSVASLIGFLTLTGIVMRNGIMMISHYRHLMKHEGEPFGEAMIVRGSLERLAPVLMTALTAMIGLVPLALGQGETGKEILHPLAIVVIGGLVSSTLLDQLVTPALFLKFGRQESPAKEEIEVPSELKR